jgi:hypothetical protein
MGPIPSRKITSRWRVRSFPDDEDDKFQAHRNEGFKKRVRIRNPFKNKEGTMNYWEKVESLFVISPKRIRPIDQRPT